MARWVEVLLNVPIRQSFTYKNTGITEQENLKGKRVEVQFGSRKSIGFAIKDFDTLPENFPIEEKTIKPVLRIIDSEELFNDFHIKLSSWISTFYLCSQGESLAAMIPSGKRESSLASIAFDDYIVSPSKVTLSEEQKIAIDGIIKSEYTKPSYIFGATGTGKTEVFLQAAEYYLEQGKSVLYLVPEISLTHQVIDAVCSRFGSLAALLHSNLTGSQRLTEWMRIKRKEARIVVGARSAIFAPIQDLGLIIIDEEHDTSYKSGNTPRYHTRQVAMYVSSTLQAKLVLGSATPSLESWYQIEQGMINKYELTQRLSGGSFPTVNIIDLKGSNSALSKELVSELHECKKENRQSLLFLNRRGFSHFFKCFTCGYELLCKNCSVPLTYHKTKSYVKCHYCGWQDTPPSVCPECSSLDVGYAGFGTEYIETEVHTKFPDYTINRIDTDSLTKKGELKKILDSFRKGEIDILLGTQMVAKGLNFPGLKLVGIILADTGLHMPDFRASERTFSLITQVTGRAGRFFPDGKVLLQTYNPMHPAIQYAAKNDIVAYYAWELAQRKELDFPPYTRLVRLVFRSKQNEIAIAGATGAEEILKQILDSRIELLGPAECPLAMISGNHRWHILLRGTDIKPILKGVHAFLTQYKPLRSLYIETDVDPLNLL